jgi:hypothetical protein
LIAAGANGVTARDAAIAIIGRAAESDLKSIKRQLGKLIKDNLARKETGKHTP